MSVLAEIPVDREAVSRLLVGLGVDLSHGLAAAVVMGATDVLIALELAQTLPGEADFDRALGELHSFNLPWGEGLPSRVVQAQQLVFDSALADESCAAISPERLSTLGSRIAASAG